MTYRSLHAPSSAICSDSRTRRPAPESGAARTMARATARTVSFAVVDLAVTAATVTYHPAAPHEPGEPTVVRLPLTPGGVS